jgi:hypothetical protein
VEVTLRNTEGTAASKNQYETKDLDFRLEGGVVASICREKDNPDCLFTSGMPVRCYGHLNFYHQKYK